MRTLIAALALTSGFAHAGTVTESAARSYVASAFITGAAPAILADDVRLGTELRARLSLPDPATRDAVYDALVAITEGRPIHVAAGPKPLARFDRAALVVEAGDDVRLLVQYDLRANHISFVGIPGTAAAAGASRGEPQIVKVAMAAPKPSVVTLRPVFFPFGSATLSEGAQALLAPELAARLRLATAIRITGRADPVGPPGYNLRLSERRAAAVRERLVALGVDASRIEVAAAGSAAEDSCDDVTPRAKRIACLAPERRADIAIELPPL